ncbi:MAG TPA: hypothetical protein VFG15_30185 [Amycolatopsis sp.]|nr:hypothetical protein [Amycolatopsis sp.]
MSPNPKLVVLLADAEPIDSSRHPVWAAVGDAADFPSIVTAVRSSQPEYEVSSVIERAVLAALDAIGYPLTRPQVFELGDAEPEDVTEVRDPAGRRWIRDPRREWYMPGRSGPVLPWPELLGRSGELVEVLPAPATPTRAEVIERAAETFCDSSQRVIPWADLAEPVRDLYRERMAALADAGLLADPAWLVEIARLRAEVARLDSGEPTP